jgi:thiamine-phosphate pyrophosphorylase
VRTLAPSTPGTPGTPGTLGTLGSLFPRLYAIVDADLAARTGWAPRDLARAYLVGGARLLQLRAKTLDSGPFLDLARAIADDARSAGAMLIVNDRADIAVLAGAAGVHVGQEDLAVPDVQRIIGPGAVVGVSTHTVAQLTAALQQPVSYVAVGPVFGTETKATGYAPIGLELITAAAQRAGPLGIPVVAIGGITLERATSVWQAGAASAAVITDLVGEDPAARVAAWIAAATTG